MSSPPARVWTGAVWTAHSYQAACSSARRVRLAFSDRTCSPLPIKLKRLTHGLAGFDCKLDVAQRREPCPNLQTQVLGLYQRLLQGGAQDLPGLLLNGSIAGGSTHPQPKLEWIVQISNGQGSRGAYLQGAIVVVASNDSMPSAQRRASKLALRRSSALSLQASQQVCQAFGQAPHGCWVGQGQGQAAFAGCWVGRDARRPSHVAAFA